MEGGKGALEGLCREQGRLDKGSKKMTTEWCTSSSPPFMGLPACGVCASSGILERRAYDAQSVAKGGSSDSSKGMSAFTVGPILRTEEDQKGAVLYVEEHDISEKEGLGRCDFAEDHSTFDDCDFPMCTPRSSSKTESFMDCNIEVSGEISCRPLQEDTTTHEEQAHATPSAPVSAGRLKQSGTPFGVLPSQTASAGRTAEPKGTGGSSAALETQSSISTTFEKVEDAKDQPSFQEGDTMLTPATVYAESGAEVVYASEHVCIWPSKDCRILGRLSLLKHQAILFLAWMPYSRGALNEDGTFQLQSTTVPESRDTDKTMYAVHPIPLSDIKAVTRHVPRLGWHYIIVVLNSGLTLPPFYFNKGGVKSFISALKEHAEPFVLKSAVDPNTFLINDTPDPLIQSLSTFNLDDLLLSRVSGDVFGTQRSAASASVEMASAVKALSSGLSMMPRVVKDTTSSFFRSTDGQRLPPGLRNVAASVPSLPGSQSEPCPEGAQIGKKSAGIVCPIPQRRSSSTGGVGDDGYADTEVGSFEVIDMKLADKTTREKRPWGLPVSGERWSTFFDVEGTGRLIHLDQFREEVFYGGVEPELRKEAWKFLLGFYPADSTQEERMILTQDKLRDYRQIRAQWMTISEKQEQKFCKWRERKKRVDKDVHRTDRSHPFFNDEDGEPLKAMRRILLTYVMYNFDLSYCQGMSDLLAPILYVLMKDVDPQSTDRWEEAESEAFWCFSALMDKRESNFHTDQRGMHSQLLALEKMLRLLDPQLFECFERLDALNFFCCFRWVLILFKREFSFDEVLRLWEALWTNHRTEHFHLYLCVAVLIDHRREILQNITDFDALLRYCVDLSNKIPLIHTMQLAEVLVVHGKPFEAECIGGLDALDVADD